MRLSVNFFAAIDLTFGKTGIKIMVTSITDHVHAAKRIHLAGLNIPKSLEITSELSNRMHRTNVGKILMQGNKISLMYYGKLLVYDVHCVETDDMSVEDGMKNLSLENTSTSFYKVTEQTTWKLFK